MPTVLGVALAFLLALRPKILIWLLELIRREVVGLWVDYSEHQRMKKARERVTPVSGGASAKR